MRKALKYNRDPEPEGSGLFAEKTCLPGKALFLRREIEKTILLLYHDPENAPAGRDGERTGTA